MAYQEIINEIQEQIGISKDFNVFELQKALSKKDVVKANLIINYFANNPKSNPIQMTVASLYNYFVKVYIAIQNLRETDQVLMRKLGVGSPYFIKEYRNAARNFTFDKVRSILVQLRKADLESKGVGARSKDQSMILKDLVYHALH